ncbi:hypothetical protein L0F63_003040, partial [Massospora cicadina]
MVSQDLTRIPNETTESLLKQDSYDPTRENSPSLDSLQIGKPSWLTTACIDPQGMSSVGISYSNSRGSTFTESYVNRSEPPVISYSIGNLTRAVRMSSKAIYKKLMVQVETYTIQRDNLKASNCQRRAKLSCQLGRLNGLNVELLNERQKVHQNQYVGINFEVTSRILWQDGCRLLGLNRARLAYGLTTIFPISQHPDGMDALCIRGNPLPTLITVSDPMAGDTALLVHHLARYLGVELAYPLLLLGSNSVILHPIAQPSLDEVTWFPLYTTKDPTGCVMGMNLLNLDIVM